MPVVLPPLVALIVPVLPAAKAPAELQGAWKLVALGNGESTSPSGRYGNTRTTPTSGW